MDSSTFFSAQELAAWSGQRFQSELIYFTGLGLKVVFLLVVMLSGIHLALRHKCQSAAAWLYERRSLTGMSRRVPVLKRVICVFEKLGASLPDESHRTRWLVDAFYPLALLILFSILCAPLSFFSGYLLEHERGLATISLGQWWLDWTKSLFESGFLAVFLGLGLFGLVRRLRRTWWLWLWGMVVGGLLLWSMLSPYRARIYHDFRPLEDGRLKAAIQELGKQAGIGIERVEVKDSSRRTRRASAYLAGAGATRRVVLSDNLVDEFNPREVLVAVGHELGHHVGEHSTFSWLRTALSALVFLVLCQVILWWAPRVKRFGLRKNVDPAVLPLLLLALEILFLVNAPVSASLDRREENSADGHALRLTRDPAAFCSLFIRLNRLNQADPRPPGWVQFLFGHHPTTMERISRGFEWAKDHGMQLSAGALPLPPPTSNIMQTRRVLVPP